MLRLAVAVALASSVYGSADPSYILPDYEPQCGDFGAANTFQGTCVSGRSQSPINIVTANVKPEPHEDDEPHVPVHMNYPASVPVTFDGNKWSLTWDVKTADAYVMREGEKFNLLQFHMHAPAEHTIDGVYTPAEAHFVHQNPVNLQLLVVGVRFSGGVLHNSHNSTWLEAISASAAVHPPVSDVHVPMAGSSIVNGILDSDFYTYMGSLTAGSCAENVIWYVSKHVEPATTAQICSYEVSTTLTPTKGSGQSPTSTLTLNLAPLPKPPGTRHLRDRAAHPEHAQPRCSLGPLVQAFHTA
jgi:carbonic anhydrase